MYIYTYFFYTPFPTLSMAWVSNMWSGHTM